MNAFDGAIFFAYVVGIFVFGLWISRRRQSPEDFHVAGRSMSWFPIGISVMATVFSAINFTAFSSEVLGHGLYVLMALPAFVLVIPFVTRVIMPFYHDLKPFSAYEFLERRFDRRVRTLASGLFIVWRLFWMATAIYATCRLLTTITGLPLLPLILLAGLIATLYTMVGGMRSVMWTDVVQFFVLFGSLVVGVLAAAHVQNGFAHVLRTASANGLTRPFYPFDPAMFSPDPRIRITLWSALIGTFTAFLARYGADQMVVQRYFTARSLADARRGFALNIACALVSLVCLAFFGLAVYGYAISTGMPIAKSSQAEDTLARFILSLPTGVCGLLAAGLLASTMSSIDSGIHSCGTAMACDFSWNRPSSAPGPAPALATDRWLTLAIGIAVTIAACWVGRLGTIFEIANKIINGFGSPLLALVILGRFGGRHFTAPGVLIGGIAGAIGSAWVGFSVTHLALHYYAVVNLLGTLAFCYLFSRFWPDRADTARASS